MKIGNLKPHQASRKRKKRVGAGPASGHGKTCGRGTKGEKARSSGPRPGFEGGQMPLIRRVPKRGFRNIFAVEFQTVNVGALENFKADSEVNPELLKEKGFIRKAGLPVKVLGEGMLKKALVVKAHSFSQSAVKKIETSGGKALRIK